MSSGSSLVWREVIDTFRAELRRIGEKPAELSVEDIWPFRAAGGLKEGPLPCKRHIYGAGR